MFWKKSSKKIFKKDNLPCWCKNCHYKTLIKDDPVGGFMILKCSKCGLARVFPIPDSSKERYADYNIDNYLKNKKLFVSFMKQILKEILKFKKEGKLLEIGSGVGYFLELARDRGFEIHGLELSKKAIQITNENLGEGVVKNCSLLEAVFPSRSFDVIIMNHVLEHILDLKSLLDEINRILKKDGILVICSPNFGGFFAKLRGRKWPGLRSKEHVWQFEQKSISNILKFNNFKILKLNKKASHNFYSTFISLKEGHVKDFLLNILNLFFGLIGRGDNMIIIAKK